MKHFKSWWPSAIVLAIILWLTLSPDPVPGNHLKLFNGADKIVHAVMMGCLTAILLYDFARNGGKHKSISRKNAAVIGLSVACFSALDEWAQGAMGLGRTSDIMDFLADLSGMLITISVLPPLINRQYKR